MKLLDQSFSIDRPIRVAMVHYRDAAVSGGSLRVGETIASYVDPSKVEVQMVFAYGGPGPVADRACVPCHYIESRGPKDFLAWRRARALFKNFNFDIVHFQDAVVWLRAALLGTRFTSLLHVHGRYRQSTGVSANSNVNQRRSPILWRATPLLRAYLKFTDAQVFISHGARNSLLNLGWVKPESSFVVYNSIDCSRFRLGIKKGEARSLLRLPENAMLLGFIGRLVWDKGCSDLLSIVERLPVQWHGVICGDGPERQELEYQCKARNLSSRIHFLGIRDDVASVYAALDAFIFLSRYEPFGLVLAEAMASGVPVFCLGADGEYREPDYPLLNHETAVIVERRHPADYEVPEAPEVLGELARRIADFGEDKAKYTATTERARAWVSKNYDAPLQAEAMTRVYQYLFRPGKQKQLDLSSLYAREQVDVGSKVLIEH